MPTDQSGVDTPQVVVGGGLRDEGVAFHPLFFV